MYCEDSAAAHIDHFRPRAIEPLSSFSWDNYLLACSICNSNYKRDEFPMGDNQEPLLLDPTVDNPEEHLVLSSRTGRYIAAADSSKGDESIRVFGLNREVLETARRNAWRVFELAIVGYGKALDEGKRDKAAEIVETVRGLSCTAVLQTLIAVVEDTELALVGPECRKVCSERPEILEWGDRA